jgi:uncharacterized protein with ParB-like and HNH nuclease domain
MSSKIQQTQKKSYKEILSSTVSFHIPTFQRAYNWKPKQLEQLWESVINNDKQYYIGNIVVVQHSTTDIQSGYLVIDGQQRLTTLSLFLVAIRNYISKDKEKDKDKQHLQKHKEMMEELRTSLIFSTSFSDESKIKLIFSKKNLSDIYKKLVHNDIINEELLDEAQARFVKNLRFINQLLKDYLKESGVPIKKAIQEIVSKILELEFIIIECRNESDVYQIFEGLNSTGLELSVVDLVKNTVFKRIKESDTHALIDAEKTWEEMENNFEQSNLNLFSKFLRHQWISNYGYINTSQLYDSIKKKLDDEMHTSQAIIKFIVNMRDDAALYIALRTGNLEFFRDKILKGTKDSEVEKYLNIFVLLDSDQIYEVLLSYCKKFILVDGYTKQQYINDIKKLWNLGLLIKVVSSVNPSKYEKKFADRCKNLANYKGKDYNKESDKFYADLWELVKDRREEFITNFNDSFVYKKGNDRNNELIRFILLSIYQRKNKGVTYEIKTVEHILSQSKYELEDYLHHIGNLTILSREMNRAASDKDFSTKYSDYYSKDIFEHNKILNKYSFESEQKEATSKRANDLAEEAFKVFSII